MENKYIIGIDVGGTNTDAVLIDNDKNIKAACKVTTTLNISDGAIKAINNLLEQSGIKTNDIKNILLGTTHATNAILQNKDIFTVGVIRIAGQRPLLPPCYSWPKISSKAIFKGVETINGGFDCNGSNITQLRQSEIVTATLKLLELKVDSIAIIGVFSPINNEQEKFAKSIVQEIAGRDFPITISSDIGGVGFIERENSTILNCALKKSMRKGFYQLESALISLDIKAPILITQNNGTLITLLQAIENPILTISAGPTNSFVGAVKLAGLSDAIVVDIGGTSTDIGIVQNGFARRTTSSSCIAGISLNFSMPDVLSIALGGGSYINIENMSVGPESSALNLLNESYAFGGNKLTLTDIALKLKYLNINGAKSELIPVNNDLALKIFEQIKLKLNTVIKQISGPISDLPVILVGGGAQLLPPEFIKNSIIPDYSYVANAYGAALAEISGTIDTVVSLTNRQDALKKIHQAAINKAISNGAKPNAVRIVNQQIIPYHYIPNNLARVIVTAIGPR